MADTPPCRPRVSIIVTNYNYGHFLGACLDSLAAQTDAPDEVIVVDDGSQDDSRARLAGRAGLRVIAQTNAGQAAGFNAGFTASSGDVVVFLDADDTLVPGAVAMIRRLWSRDVSMLCWDMMVTDAAGNGIASYPSHVPDIDQWPAMLRTLGLRFMPTSGNAFTRAHVDWAFPLPEADWRLCADALLIRCAVMAAPLWRIPHVLSRYRVHGHNSYARVGTVALWQHGNDHADRGLAGLDLLALADRAGRAVPPGQRYALIAAAIESGLSARDIGTGRPDLRRLWRAATGPLGRGLPARARASLAAMVLAGRVGLSRPHVPVADRVPPPRPLIGQRILGAALRQRLDDDCRPRAAPLVAGPVDRFEGSALVLACHGAGWMPAQAAPFAGTGAMAVLPGGGELTFQRTYAGAAHLTLTVTPDADALWAEVEIRHQSRVCARQRIDGQTRIELTLPPAAPAGPDPDVIALRAIASRRLPRARGDRWGPPADLVVLSFDIARSDAPLPATVAPTGFASAAAGAVTTFEAGDRTDAAATSRAIRLAAPPFAGPAVLLLDLGDDQPAGLLVLTLADTVLLRCRVLPGQRLAVDVPRPLRDGETMVIVGLSFRGDEAADQDAMSIVRLGWLRGPLVQTGPALMPGAWLLPGDAALGRALQQGWTFDDDAAPRIEGAGATLGFACPASWGDGASMAEIDLECAAALPAGAALIVAVAADGGPPAIHRFQGEGLLAVPLPATPTPTPGRHVVEIDLAVAPDGQVPDPAARHPGLILRGFGLAASNRPGGPPRQGPQAPVPAVGPVPPFYAALAALRPAVATPQDAALLLPLAAQMHAAVAAMAPAAAAALIDSEVLSLLAALDRRLAGEARGLPGPGPLPPAAAARGGLLLRWIAVGMLAGGAAGFAARRALTGERLPWLAQPLVAPVAQWLAHHVPPEPDAAQCAAARALHDALCAAACAEITAAPPGHPRRHLGASILAAMDASAMAHLGDPASARALAHAVEVLASADGEALDLPPAAAPGAGARRVTFLLARGDALAGDPALAAALRALAAAGQRPVVVALDATGSSTAGAEVAIRRCDGLSAAATAAAIRADMPDVVIVAGATGGADRLACVAAHRLAPRQLAWGAAGPVAAFGSTDGVLTLSDLPLGWSASDRAIRLPVAPETARTACMAGTPDLRTEFRARHGLPASAPLVLAAVAPERLHRGLTDAWAQILAQVPDAILLVCTPVGLSRPEVDETAVLSRLSRRLADADVGPGRIRLWTVLDAAAIGLAVSAADLVIETWPAACLPVTLAALAAGCPVIALEPAAAGGETGAAILRQAARGDHVAHDVPDLVARSVALLGAATAPRSTQPHRIRARRDQRGGGGRAAGGAAEDASAEASFAAAFLAAVAGHHPAARAAAAGAPRYLFHHLPKSGGTSLKSALGQWFTVVADYRAPRATETPPPLALDRLGPGDLLAGHFAADDMPLAARYPETADPTRWRRFTFLRDPLETALSDYFFTRRKRTQFDPSYSAPTLGAYLADYPGLFLRHFECTADTWPEVLQSYWFVGTLDRIDDCLGWLARSLGRPALPPLPRSNETLRDATPSPQDIARFRARMAVEYAIYDQVQRDLDARLGSWNAAAAPGRPTAAGGR